MRDEDLALMRRLEEVILSRRAEPGDGLGRAVAVGLRYDRLAREGFLPSQGRPGAAGLVETTGGAHEVRAPHAGAYWACNCLAVAALLKGSRNVLAACEESWAGESLLPETARATRLSGKRLLAGASRSPGAGPGVDPLLSDSAAAHDDPGHRGSALPTGPFDAVLADSSILLLGELAQSLSGFRRVLSAHGRAVLLLANWGYEMDGTPVAYDLSFKRYRGNVYAGLVKRTMEPAREVEYVCLLDPDEKAVRTLAELPRHELRQLGMDSVPDLGRLVVSAEMIEIPQATAGALEAAGREAGFSLCAVAGAPGILAAGACDATRVLTECQKRGGSPPEPTSDGPEKGAGPTDDIRRALASSFPFVPAADCPHLLAVLLA